ncbi:MAG: plasmid maintenance protein CcdB [Betaproteobacteria bacterium HGW-Betaproteobacteria-12]|jgi:antitoxin CcdA|nr:MAG: plasmid maintenance protein CcdB [Betaproteobacteria bacterium HGW-Betaproteobacteria-12]
MKSIIQTPPVKRPVNLLLNEANVERARQYTANLSATVDALLAEFVERERLQRDEQRQHYAALAAAWNRLEELNGSFADEHSTL